MSHRTDCIKNVSIAGHGGTGKTSLFESLLFAGGVISKAETVESGKTVSDSSPEEIERKISIRAAMAHLERNGTGLNLFDTPGSSDFIGDVMAAFRAAEFVVLTVDGRSGVQIETIKLWRELMGQKKPRCLCVTRMDDERADFTRVLEDATEKFNASPVILTLPMGHGSLYKGVIDVLEEKAYFVQPNGLEREGEIPPEYQTQVGAAKERLLEAAAEGNEILTEKYILLGELEPEEVRTGLKEALAQRKALPLFVSAGLKNSGLIPLLAFLTETAPGAETGGDVVLEEGVERPVPINAEAPLSAVVIKTVFDQFSGKLSWIKVITGVLKSDQEFINKSEGKKERAGKLYRLIGKKMIEIKELSAGDIGVLSKSPSLKTNDTIAASAETLEFLPLRLPEPVHSVAVNAGAKKDDDKLGEWLLRSAEEDKTFRYVFNPETKETVISGMGELQVSIILDKIKQNQKIAVETHVPRVPYRETITKKASAEYTHKKQTGGHGQYGRVVLEIAPLPRGEQYRFVNAIFGGAVSKGYIPGVEKGVQEGMSAGTMAGYPVVDLEVKIVDGKEHPVDSSELAFKLAARNAFREAMRHGAPVLLEPIMNLTVFVESKYLGDVLSDLSGKRGKILGQDSAGGIEEIRAQAPQSELLRYSIDLRSITSGTGSFSVRFDHYSPISGKTADEVVKAAQGFRVQETEE
jgi:elongation factor G